MLVPFATGSRRGKAFAVDTEHLVNFYPEYTQSPYARAIASLVGRPGYTLLGNFGENPARGLEAMGANLYVVFLGNLLEVSTAGVGTDKGALDTIEGNVSMAENGNELVLVDGTSGYSYLKDADDFAKITSGGFPSNPGHVTIQDDFFLVQKANTEEWYKSALGDGRTWDALDVAKAQKSPDRLLTLIGDHGEIWLFGEASVEIWQNVGSVAGTTFPFARLDGAHIQRGIHAPWSLARFNDTLAALMVSPESGLVEVCQFRGYQPVSISVGAMNDRIKAYASSIDAIGFVYSSANQEFYVLAFPSAGETWAYDHRSGEWFEMRHSYGERWLPERHAYLLGNQYVDDRETGNIYRLDETLYDDNGTSIHGQITGYHIQDQDQYLFHHELELYFERGTALATGQGSNPKAHLRWSNDGGRTFGNWHAKAIGEIGEYGHRARWRNLGLARDRVYEVRVSDPIKRVLVGARFDVG